MCRYDEVEEADLVVFRLKYEFVFSMVLGQEEVQDFPLSLLFFGAHWSHKAP